MKTHLGIDVGAVGAKAALVCPKQDVGPILSRNGTRAVLRQLATPDDKDVAVLVMAYRRTKGRPVEFETHAVVLDAAGLPRPAREDD